MIVSEFFEINEKLRIQIWQFPPDKEEIKEISLDRNFTLRSTEIYIVLEKTLESDIYHYNLFYWVGSESHLMQRKNVAYKVVLLKTYLLKTQNSRLILFDREIDGLESEKFCHLLDLGILRIDSGMTSGKTRYAVLVNVLSKSGKDVQISEVQYIKGNRPEISNLYKVDGSRGDIISLSPLSGNFFYNTDTYVLQKRSEVIIWIADHALPGKANAARLLAKRIVKVDLQKQDEENDQYISVIDNLQTEEGYNKFYRNFLKLTSKLDGNCYFNKPITLSNYHIMKYTHDIIEVNALYIQRRNNLWCMNQITFRPLKLQAFKKTKTYVLKLSKSGYMFIYLGKEAPATLIQYTLAYMEDIVFADQTKWRNITIVREGELLPTHFIIHFWDEVKNLIPLLQSSTTDVS